MNSESVIRFYDESDKVLVNMVALADSTAVPRQGEAVILPGEGGIGSGSYSVSEVRYEYTDRPGEPPELRSVLIKVRRKLSTMIVGDYDELLRQIAAERSS